MRIACTCHDPTVFGHLTCSRAETQPNNTAPRPPATRTTLINTGGMRGATITCAIEDEITRINELHAATQDMSTNVAHLAEMLRYLNRRYNGPPPHG